jgi:hypothetical protein
LQFEQLEFFDTCIVIQKLPLLRLLPVERRYPDRFQVPRPELASLATVNVDVDLLAVTSIVSYLATCFWLTFSIPLYLPLLL